MDPLNVKSSLAIKTDGSPKILNTKVELKPIPTVVKNSTELQVGRNTNTIQFVRIELPEGLLQKSLTPANNSANNVDQYVLVKNENDIVKSLKPIQIKPNNQPLLAPKTPSSSTSTSQQTFLKLAPRVKTKRDEQRRFQHNQIEKARREKINNWIMELATIIPETFNGNDNISSSCSSNSNNNNNNSKEALSKGGILAKAFEYITHLKNTNYKLTEMQRNQSKHSTESKQSLEIRRLLDENEQLKLENAMLKRKLSLLNIDVDLEEVDIDTKKMKTSSDDNAEELNADVVEFVDST